MAGPKLTTLTIFSKIIGFLLTTSVVNSEYSPSCTGYCPPYIPGAVAFWPMTMETKGSDISGNNNHAKFVGLTYTDGPTGEDNGAVHFNGSSNSYAWVTNSPTIDVGKYPGFSFSGLIRVSSVNKPASLIDWSGEGGYGMYIEAHDQQQILLKLHPNNDTNYNHVVEFTNLNFNTSSWHFIGMSYDKATGKASAFVDGQQEMKQLDRDIVAGTDKTRKVGLGKDMSNPSASNYNGDMSCMMLFKYALTADDFKRVMEFCRTTQSIQKSALPNITVSDIAATSATASWTESPGIFSGYNITIERKQSGLDKESVHPPFIPASDKFLKSVLKNLVPSAAYRIHVWHMQRDIIGRARSSAWFDTEPSLVVESDSIIFSEITATSATVRWKEVTGNHDGYTVDISPTTGGAKVDPGTVPRGTTTTSLINLSPRTYYTIRIITKIGSRMTYPSTRLLYTPEPSLFVDSDSIVFSEITSTSAKVSWKDVTGDYDGYSVDIRPTTGGAKADPSTVPRGTTTTSLKNLSPGSFYIIAIRTKVDLRTSSPSVQAFQTFPTLDSTEQLGSSTTNVFSIIAISSFVFIAVVSIAVVSIVVHCKTISHKSTNKGPEPTNNIDQYRNRLSFERSSNLSLRDGSKKSKKQSQRNSNERSSNPSLRDGSKKSKKQSQRNSNESYQPDIIYLGEIRSRVSDESTGSTVELVV